MDWARRSIQIRAKRETLRLCLGVKLCHSLIACPIASQVLVQKLENRRVGGNLICLLGEAVALVVEDYILNGYATLLVASTISSDSGMIMRGSCGVVTFVRT